MTNLEREQLISTSPSDPKTSLSSLESVEPEVLARLLDPDEEDFVRSKLSQRDFRHAQRLRVRAAIAYIKSIRRNAGLLIQIGERRIASEANAKTECEPLVRLAVEMRTAATIALVRMYIVLLVPTMRLRVANSFNRYRQLIRMAQGLLSESV